MRASMIPRACGIRSDMDGWLRAMRDETKRRERVCDRRECSIHPATPTLHHHLPSGLGGFIPVLATSVISSHPSPPIPVRVHPAREMPESRPGRLILARHSVVDQHRARPWSCSCHSSLEAGCRRPSKRPFGLCAGRFCDPERPLRC